MKLTLDDPIYADKRPLLSKRAGKITLIIAVTVVLTIAGAATGSFIASSLLGNIKVPVDIVQKVRSAIYIPSSLPGSFNVQSDSFLFDEDTLIFTASDKAGAKIVFTEQAKPANFDFNNFYIKNIVEPRTLSDVPFPSVTGKAPAEDRTLLSVVTDDTWVLVSTTSSLSVDDMQKIAEGIKKY